MTTGSPFTPTPFTTSIVSPTVTSQDRSASYISVSGYRFAPTSVGTDSLVAGSTTAADSTASLADVIKRASDWVDEHCFHRADATLVASVTTESRFVQTKPNGSLPLMCNIKPVIEVIGIAGGASPAQLQNLDSTTAQSVWIEGGKTIWVPGGFSFGITPQFPTFTAFPTYYGGVFSVWTYVAGFPLATLGADVTAGDTTLTLKPGVTGDTTIYGVYAGTPLTIKDGAKTETVIASAAPNGLTVTLQAGTAFAHTVPTAPDSVVVTALPSAIEQATISLTTVLLKTRGVRSQVIGSIGSTGKPSAQAMGYAGALDDYNLACRLLKPYVAVVVH